MRVIQRWRGVIMGQNNSQGELRAEEQLRLGKMGWGRGKREMG